jgi:hypothetical protein
MPDEGEGIAASVALIGVRKHAHHATLSLRRNDE